MAEVDTTGWPIWKIQKPLFSSDEPIFLVYNKSRTEQFQMPVTDEILQMFGDDLKIYVQGRLAHGKFEIGKRVKDRSW